MAFRKATKELSRLRLAFIGPPGSGKTMSALRVAEVIARWRGGPIAVIDTERGSASKYARTKRNPDGFDFEVDDSFDGADAFRPSEYIARIEDAERLGAGVIVIDSLSHAWESTGGILDQLDNKGGRFDAWKNLTPQHRELVDAMLRSKCDVIVTMRVKVEYVVEKNDKGKNEPRKVGLAPVQRQGLEYEFDLVADIDDDHVARVSKTRCKALDRASIREPGPKLAETLIEWLSDGEPPAPRAERSERAEDRDEHARTEKPEPSDATAARAHETEHGDRVTREVDAADAFLDALHGTETPGDVASCWLKHRAAVKELSASTRVELWNKAVRRAERNGLNEAAEPWLIEAVKKEERRRADAADEEKRRADEEAAFERARVAIAECEDARSLLLWGSKVVACPEPLRGRVATLYLARWLEMTKAYDAAGRKAVARALGAAPAALFELGDWEPVHAALAGDAPEETQARIGVDASGRAEDDALGDDVDEHRGEGSYASPSDVDDSVTDY